jgi:hypothetical protein
MTNGTIEDFYSKGPRHAALSPTRSQVDALMVSTPRC